MSELFLKQKGIIRDVYNNLSTFEKFGHYGTWILKSDNVSFRFFASNFVLNEKRYYYTYSATKNYIDTLSIKETELHIDCKDLIFITSTDINDEVDMFQLSLTNDYGVLGFEELIMCKEIYQKLNSL